MMKRYIIRKEYRDASGSKRVADFIVTSPQLTPQGILATSETAWGGAIRELHRWDKILDFREECE